MESKVCSNFQLLPIHNRLCGRMLPLSMGRKKILTWWWQACPCQGTTTRTPCIQCRFLSGISQSLSKAMFNIQSDGLIQMSPNNRNPGLLWINGDQAHCIEYSGRLQGNDVIKIGKSYKDAWMTFVVQGSTVVTPDTEKWISTRQVKPQRRRSLFHSKRNQPIKTESDNKTQYEEETEYLCSKESVKRRLYLRKERILPHDRFRLQTDHGAVVDRSGNEVAAKRSKTKLHCVKRKRKLSLSSSPEIIPREENCERSITSHEGDESLESNQLATSDANYFGQNVPTGNRPAPAVETNRETVKSQESEIVSERKDLIRPSTQQRTMLRIGPSDQSSILSLPRCHSMEHHQVFQPSSEGDVILETCQRLEASETYKREKPPYVQELTTSQWKARQVEHPSRFHRSLASIVVCQRVRRNDHGWLPEILQG